MFGSKSSKKKKRVTYIDSLIAQGTEIQGNIIFKGNLHIDGKVIGDIIADNDENSALILSEEGFIEGEIRVPSVILNGELRGDVHSNHHIELAPKARIHGNVYYNLIEMEIGAEVNGSLVHTDPQHIPIDTASSIKSPTHQRKTATRKSVEKMVDNKITDAVLETEAK